MLIDFHTHCFPDKIAQKALEKLAYSSGGMEYYTDGTIGGLKKSMQEEDVDTAVILNIATNEHQMESVNNFAASVNNNSDIFAFGSVHPDAQNALEELERIKSLGLKGVKLHPEYQKFYVDDEKMKPIYKKISQLGLVLVFHAGYDYGAELPFHGMPNNFKNALKWIDTPTVAAHWGGVDCGIEVLEMLCGTDLYFDTSFGYGQMPREIAMKIIEKHGTDKMLFATDSPWRTREMEKRFLNTLELSDSELDAIYNGNAKRLLGINQ